MSKLAILGASGHGKVVADIGLLNGYQEILFFDDRWPELKQCGQFPVVGNTATLLENSRAFDGIAIGIGNNDVRFCKFSEIQTGGGHFPLLIHPRATVASSASLGAGTVVMAGAVINPDTQVGDVCIVNTLASVDHDCVLGNAVHICPKTALAGGVAVGDRAWVGIGSSVIQGMVIGSAARVGAGSVVISDIPQNKTYFGVPAREHH